MSALGRQSPAAGAVARTGSATPEVDVEVEGLHKVPYTRGERGTITNEEAVPHPGADPLRAALALALAAYNAGPTRVAGWHSQLPDAEDNVFVEAISISIAETRDHVMVASGRGPPGPGQAERGALSEVAFRAENACVRRRFGGTGVRP